MEQDFVVNNNDNKVMEKFGIAIKKHGFCIIKNFVNEDILRKKIKLFKASFSPDNDVRKSGPMTYKMKNFQRVDLGDYRQINARFVRTFTQFTWDKNSTFYDEVRKIVVFRNEYCGLKEGNDGVYTIGNSKYCDLPKLAQYPVGGGFMNCHRDDNNEYAVMNVLLSLCKRGEDFMSGGVYYHDRNNNFLDVENILGIGDLYAHDIKTPHGVRAIDDEKPIDLKTLSGRLAINLSLEKFQF